MKWVKLQLVWLNVRTKSRNIFYKHLKEIRCVYVIRYVIIMKYRLISDYIVQWTMLKTILEDKRFCKKSSSIKELIEPKIYDTFHINSTELAKRIESLFAFGYVSPKSQWTLNGMLCIGIGPQRKNKTFPTMAVSVFPPLSVEKLSCMTQDRSTKNAMTAALEYKKNSTATANTEQNGEKPQIHKSISCCLHWRFYINLEYWNEQYQLQW